MRQRSKSKKFLGLKDSVVDVDSDDHKINSKYISRRELSSAETDKSKENSDLESDPKDKVKVGSKYNRNILS